MKRAIAGAALSLAACQVGGISVVECRVNDDCGSGTHCDASHRCVEASDAGTGGLGGFAGAPLTDPYVSTPLTWSDSGVIDSNPFGIHGQWVWTDDCGDVADAIAAGLLVCPVDAPTQNCCTSRDPSLSAPLPDQGAGMSVAGSHPGTPGKVCFKGATAPVIALAAAGTQWGMNGGVLLADWADFDATADFVGGPIVGFRMVVDGPATNTLLNVTFASMGNIDYGIRVRVPAGRVTLSFSEAEAPDWVVSPEPLDPSRIYEVLFHVGGSPDVATPFDFCVSDMHVLQARGTP